jgi:hypothetical protein
MQEADRYPGSPEAAPRTTAPAAPPDEPSIVFTIIRILFIIIGICFVASSFGDIPNSAESETQWVIRGVEMQRDIYWLVLGALFIGIGLVGRRRI